ncbi:M20 family metallopeptidase [Opitutaceae bacterium]|nr:M20 family metallopeptidase [Opitutaceae bacterium]
MPITPRLQELQPEIASWRQDIHQNPEILFDTHRTSALVAEKLKEFGCDSIKTGIGRTGVVGVIKGRENTSGKVIALRADMDALPIFEDTGLPYASKTDGKMHACGHDGHTSMLLGASKYLAETRNFDGTAVVIYQPAEEGGGGGGEMCADGMMEEFGIQEVYGMHNMPGIPLGQFAIREGSFFAATDEFTIDVTGLGGHAAKPDEAIDTTVISAQIVIALQTIASRNLDPLKALVVSVTSFRTESEAYNVIPERVQLRGTVRTMDKDIRELAEKRIKELTEHTAAAYGATAEIKYKRGYPVMVNAPAQTAFAAEVAAEVVGPNNVTTDAAAIMGGEDFAFMLEERPGAYILVGNGDTAMVHHPKYDFNDDAIPSGSSFWVQLIEKAMPLT